MANLTILSKEIRQLDGLYSLNDLHKAAGAKENHRPSKFIRNTQTKDLIAEIEQTPNLAIEKNQSPNLGFAIKTCHGGSKGGTYVCKELLLAYAMWISPIIHLHVLRAFLLMYQQPSLPAPRKKYSYPRRLLEQPGFMTGDNTAPLCPSMLANTRAFVSPLLSLLNELRADGHDVSAPWDEAIAMREAIINMDEELKDICYRALKASNKPASTQLKEAVRRKS